MSYANAKINYIVDYLMANGKRIMTECYESREWHNRTYNLHDSFGCTVYVRGKEVESKRYVFEPPKGSIQASMRENVLSGSDAIKAYFEGYKCHTSGFELVIAATMPYARILEKGVGSNRKKYQVISASSSEIDSLAAEITSKIKGISGMVARRYTKI